MTKEVTKAIILQELQDKFKLREYAPSPFLFDETVVPTYDIGRHLVRGYTDLASIGITSTGGTVFYTVPDTEIWSLNLYDVIFVTGVYTIAGVYINRRNKSGVNASVYLDLTAAQSVSYHVTLPVPILLFPGDTLMINVDGYTSSGNLRLIIDVCKEEIR